MSIGQMYIGQMSIGQMSIGQMFFDKKTPNISKIELVVLTNELNYQMRIIGTV
jgi:hypothetical protein